MDKLLDLLIFFRFLATGSFIKVSADLCGVSCETSWNAVARIINEICKIRSKFIKFPLSNEFASIIGKFSESNGFPGVLGCVDGTHIPILVPNNDIREKFRNRKGNLSLNIQMICGPDKEIYDIVARYPGSTHDAKIWNESAIKATVEALPEAVHILGDSDYPLSLNVLTPYRNPQLRTESNLR